MSYEFIGEHKEKFAVTKMCQVLEVSRSGYYSWRKRPVSQREQANEALVEQIKEIHQQSRQTYGSPRIHATLKQRGVYCGRKRVARLMRLYRIAVRRRRPYRPVTTQRRAGDPVAPNRLGQDFTAAAPNRKWVADISYIDTAEGWLYLATILDLFSRKVVGWAMADHMQTSLVKNALDMALGRRTLNGNLLHHSDRGSQYTSAAYQTRLASHPIQASMSRVGNCYDNAVAESFFATLKTECASHRFQSRREARTAIFEFIEVWYNRQRLHSSLGYRSPEGFEQQYFLDINSVH